MKFPFLIDSALNRHLTDTFNLHSNDYLYISAAMAGLVGIGAAFLVGEFGNIFQTAVSFFGAIASPIDGLFVVAIIAPWVHGKV